MEVTGVVLNNQPSLCFSKELQSFSSPRSVVIGRRRIRGDRNLLFSSGFCDLGHLQYYQNNCSKNPGLVMKCEKKEMVITKELKKKKKEKLKLLKGLSRDLSTFAQIGFGLDSDAGLVDQVKGNMISEATDVLQEQLQKLKAEAKELKRKRKEEKIRLKAVQMQNRLARCEMSSSSSSESSSDSECGEVVDMNALKRSQANQNASLPIWEAIPTPTVPVMPVVPLLQNDDPKPGEAPVLANSPMLEEKIPVLESLCCSGTESICYGLYSESRNSVDTSTSSKKIEVCMGGKCKKSGGAALLEEFQRVVGVDIVSGCKCMGKCRDGPNVRVLNMVDAGSADNSVRSPNNNPLCIGVGLEDVNMIVSNFLGQNQNQLVEFAA